MKPLRTVLLAACLASLGGVLGACGGSDDTPTEGGVGDRTAYAFKVTTFDGDTFDAADNEGKPVVLNFWESW